MAGNTDSGIVTVVVTVKPPAETPTRLPVPIDRMPEGHFWTTAAAIGSSDEEMELLAAGTLRPDRALIIEARWKAAFASLADMEIPGYRWHAPVWQRAS